MSEPAGDDAAHLIAEVGHAYLRARRYRAIVEQCEEWLGRAMDVGARLRAQGRTPSGGPAPDRAALEELRGLVSGFAAAVGRVRGSDAYQRAAAAWDARRFDAVAALAPAVFADVTLHPTRGVLHVSVDVAGGRGSAEHFASPAAVAERVVALVRGGIPAADPPPEIGADEILRAVLLEEDAEACGSPVTIAVAAADVLLPTFRADASGLVLVYAERLSAAATVRLASETADEWWAIRPDAYATFSRELSGALRALGVERIERA